MKKSSTAYVLWLLCCFGIAGGNRFYLGKYGTGVIWLLTFGLFGIGLIYDLFSIPRQVANENNFRMMYQVNINNFSNKLKG